MMKPSYTLIDFLKEGGYFAQISMGLFVGALVFALCVQILGMGLRIRLAFLPLALVPFFLGFCGFSYETFELLYRVHDGFNAAGLLSALCYFFPFLMISSLQTAILLLVCFALLLAGGRRDDERLAALRNSKS